MRWLSPQRRALAVVASVRERGRYAQHAWGPMRCALRGAAVRHQAHGGTHVVLTTRRATVMRWPSQKTGAAHWVQMCASAAIRPNMHGAAGARASHANSGRRASVEQHTQCARDERRKRFAHDTAPRRNRKSHVSNTCAAPKISRFPAGKRSRSVCPTTARTPHSGRTGASDVPDDTHGQRLHDVDERGAADARCGAWAACTLGRETNALGSATLNTWMHTHAVAASGVVHACLLVRLRRAVPRRCGAHGVRPDARCVATLCRHHARHDMPVVRSTRRDGDAPAFVTEAHAPSSRVCASAAARPNMHGVRRDARCVATPCLRHAHGGTPVVRST